MNETMKNNEIVKKWKWWNNNVMKWIIIMKCNEIIMKKWIMIINNEIWRWRWK